MPAIASLPNIVPAAAVCSASDSPPRLFLRLSITPRRVFIFPPLSVRLMPYLSIAAAIFFVGLARFTSEVFNAVPDMELLTPELAIRPRASETSSTLYFIAPATDATYLKLSPIMLTFVLALEDACASTSAKCPESAAVRWNADRASVIISLVVESSSPDAAARFNMPSMPSSISCGFQPAMPI